MGCVLWHSFDCPKDMKANSWSYYIFAVCTAKTQYLTFITSKWHASALSENAWFLLPSQPAKLGMSLQNLHWPQSFVLHPVHCPHLLRLFAVGNKYGQKLKLLGPNQYRYIIPTLQCCAFIVLFFIGRRGLDFGCMIIHKQKVRGNGHSRWSNHCSILDTLNVSCQKHFECCV